MFKYIKTREVASPERGTAAAAGIDFFVPNDFEAVSLAPGESLKVGSGIKMIIPEGWSLLFVNKSGWGAKGIVCGAQLVDSDYRGEVHLSVWNISKNFIKIEPGMKLQQGMMVETPNMPPQEIEYEEFSVYENSERGSGGFGSTGLKYQLGQD